MTTSQFFTDHPEAAVAFSGGVDSAWLLHEAVRHARRTAAYFVKTPFQPDFELDDARDTVRRLGASLTVLALDILAVPAVAANPADRCYHCKRALFTRLLEAAAADGFPLVLDGSNASDDAGDRPGMRALRELGVRSPLRECGLSKADIRRLAREAELPVWDKPSYACLATRIPSGREITGELLSRVEQAENLLFSYGFTDFRVRIYHGAARLQIKKEEIPEFLAKREEITGGLLMYFEDVFLDCRVSR